MKFLWFYIVLRLYQNDQKPEKSVEPTKFDVNRMGREFNGAMLFTSRKYELLKQRGLLIPAGIHKYHILSEEFINLKYKDPFKNKYYFVNYEFIKAVIKARFDPHLLCYYYFIKWYQSFESGLKKGKILNVNVFRTYSDYCILRQGDGFLWDFHKRTFKVKLYNEERAISLIHQKKSIFMV